MDKLTKGQLRQVIKTTIEIQQKLRTRMETEEGDAKTWTADQIAYQKTFNKAAWHALGGGYVVDGVKPADYDELVEYYHTVSYDSEVA